MGTLQVDKRQNKVIIISTINFNFMRMVPRETEGVLNVTPSGEGSADDLAGQLSGEQQDFNHRLDGVLTTEKILDRGEIVGQYPKAKIMIRVIGAALGLGERYLVIWLGHYLEKHGDLPTALRKLIRLIWHDGNATAAQLKSLVGVLVDLGLIEEWEKEVLDRILTGFEDLEKKRLLGPQF